MQMEQKRENLDQFELRQIQVLHCDRLIWRFWKFLWRILHINIKIIERAFQLRITCAIWTSNEGDMPFWKSVRAEWHRLVCPWRQWAAPRRYCAAPQRNQMPRLFSAAAHNLHRRNATRPTWAEQLRKSLKTSKFHSMNRKIVKETRKHKKEKEKKRMLREEFQG